MFPVEDNHGETKYSGRSVARVIDNIDPKKQGRIRVYHPYLGESVWIDYLRLPGQFSVPEIGELVYLEADAGYLEFPVAWGNLTRDEDELIPEEFQRSMPTNRGLFTPGGHLLELDDGTGITGLEQKGVRLTTSGGKKFYLNEDLIASDNKILLEDENGNKVEIDVITNLITIATAAGAQITVDGVQDTINLENSFGSSVSLEQGTVTASNPQASITIDTSGEISVSGPVGNFSIASSGDIELANATGSLVINAAGQVELMGATDGVVALLSETLQVLSTTVAAGFGAPISTVAQFAALKVRTDLIKA